MHKLPSTRKSYRVTLIVPDTGTPVIEYHQVNASPKKPNKSVPFVDLLFADKKHDINNKFAFSLYSISKTITLIAKDETTMNEWLAKIRDCHSDLYPELKNYDAIFEANLLDKGLAKTMNLAGQYRLALSKDSFDLIPVLTPAQIQQQQKQHHHHQQQQQHKRHPVLKAKTIELVLRSIRRCGHTDCNFYIESGRHSQLGEGDLWMTLPKKSTARYLHELMLTTMKVASNTEDQFLYKAPQKTRVERSVEIDILPPIINTDPSEDESGYLNMA